MHNALRVLTRDLRRFARVPQAIAILLGIIVIPSLYAWFNIIAFWDPYSNTKEVRVDIVNLDRGAKSELAGEVNVGAQVVEQLKQNHDLGWQFVGKEEALAAVRSGDSYAAIILPPTFSKDLLSVTTDKFVRPEIEYYVNEKANAIAPKITDVGASTLETQINSNFVSMVSKTIAEDLEKAGVKAGDRLVKARDDTVSALDDADARVESAREGLTDIESSLGSGEVALRNARAALVEVDGALGGMQSAIAQSQSLMAEVQRDLVKFTDSVTKTHVQSAAHLTKASASLNASVGKITAGAQEANTVITGAVNDATALVQANGRLLAELRVRHASFDAQIADVQDQIEALEDQLEEADPDPADPLRVELEEQLQELQSQLERLESLRDRVETVIETLQKRNTADQQLLQNLQTLNKDISTVTKNIEASSKAIDDAVRRTVETSNELGSVLLQTIPSINRELSAMSASASAFSSALGAQRKVVAEAVSLIDALGGQLADTNAALTSLDGNLADMQKDLAGLRTDLTALSTADIWNKVRALTGLKPDRIAEFMASPVQVKEHALFPVATYGSAMAPLFTNLSLWIAAFVLVVLLKQEVDTEGIEGLTVRQAYLGRWMLLAVINFFQALLVSVGNIVIGVQMANAVAFVGTSVFIGLVYVSIIYAIAVSFGYVGKGVIILLVIVQIPGASGIYPIEMMPPFFQALFPFFPFTYGINALRETIGGFYDGYYWRYVAVLLLFAVLAFLLGLLLRQRLGNLARLFNRQLSNAGLFVSEDVQILGSRRRLSQIVQALTNRDKFREETARQARRFSERRPMMLRLTLLLGLVITAILAALGLAFPDAKATVLGLWGVLCLLVIGFVVVIEYIKQNIAFATTVGDLPEPELQVALENEEAATHSDTCLDKIKEQV